jgi:Protein of unknown function (DUF3341)
MKHPLIFGYLAEFENPTELVVASKKAYGEGYRKMDAYSPFPIEKVAEAIGVHGTRLSLVALFGGLLGLAIAFGMQYWISVIDYPINVGGRPFNSWPAFVIPCFELTILGTALATVIGLFAMNGLPLPYHPLFNVPQFLNVSKDGFFLLIEATDPRFDVAVTETFLRSLNPSGVWEVPH